MCGIGDQWNLERARSEEVPQEAGNGNALIIFVKNPEKGKVKTRLAKTIGDEQALDAYIYMLRHTRDVALNVKADRFLFYTDFVDPDDLWPSEGFRKSLQFDGDLGEKMFHAFETVFAEGFDRVLIIGSDCLDLCAAHVEEAFSALKEKEHVIGPAEDGGYYLLGMQALTLELFVNKSWSTDQVFPSTIKDIEDLGREVHLLDTLSDIDYEEDWVAALERNK